MKKLTLSLGFVFAIAAMAGAADPTWPPERQKESEFTERKLETFQHGSLKEWGYAEPQKDTFLVLHPKEAKANSPLYVVLHSAGHDVHSCLACTTKVGNHDIYRSPPDFFALYLDCKANKGDWWWGSNKYTGPEVSPTDKRVIDTVKWAIKQYGIDENRVYLCGNSMGGSGTLGIGIRNGDVFAAIKANVPAEVKHVSNRMYFGKDVPADVKLPDPPIVVDYSAQNDTWSRGHDAFIKAMNDRKYPLFMYWGPFGHANNHENIMKVNDLINSFDWLSVLKNQAYPVFTDATTNDPLPWPNDLKSTKAGQINGFFRWKNVSDTADAVEMNLSLVKDLKTSFAVPTEATADVSLRRLQKLRVAPGATVRWTFGKAEGEAKADAAGVITIPKLKFTAEPTSLIIKKSEQPTKAPATEWVDVTNNVGGEKWGAYGVTYMKAVPGSDAVIAGVSECGLWSSSDGGATWKKLGGAEIKNRPGRIVFDPKDPSIYWVSGCYGDSPFKTDDGGKTFKRLGKLAHADGVDVDFGDPERKTLLLGLHEQSQSLQLSTDGGQTWKKIGDKLPAESNHSTDPVLLDSKTFLINTAGWKQKATLGIYRTEDAGETWTQVSTLGPAGQPLVASDGAIYWQRLYGGGLLKSTDKGKTWVEISKAIKNNPIELPGKRLAGLAGSQIIVSSDGGATWTKVGPPAPMKPNGITYSEKGKCFYAWQLADNLKKPAQSIVRLNAE